MESEWPENFFSCFKMLKRSSLSLVLLVFIVIDFLQSPLSTLENYRYNMEHSTNRSDSKHFFLRRFNVTIWMSRKANRDHFVRQFCMKGRIINAWIWIRQTFIVSANILIGMSIEHGEICWVRRWFIYCFENLSTFCVLQWLKSWTMFDSTTHNLKFCSV